MLRIGQLKRLDKTFLLVSLAATAFSLFYGLAHLSDVAAAPNKWIASSGLLATMSGVIQLEVSGLFDKLLAHYDDVEKYPGGPPSRVTREVIYNPDRPIAMAIEAVLFFQLRTGFWLIVAGTLLQVWSVWL